MEPRDQTFITIHNLTPHANILFASYSIVDILQYDPEEVKGRSCFDYFHPDEVPFARSVHNRGVLLDKAAVLHYARIRARDGTWVNCECCFTVVHDVLVACTSIYLGGPNNQRRAMDAPQIQRIFSNSPRDPRYHMLEHLCPKFRTPPMEREPRAALILDRFTRNSHIMFATNAVTTILGLTPEELENRRFWDCIQPNCLPDAERVVESAKANESIAYLRFWFKDPRIGEDDEDEDDDDDDMAEDPNSSNSDSDGGVQLDGQMDGQMDVDDPAPLSTASATVSGSSAAFGSRIPAHQAPIPSQAIRSATVAAAPAAPAPLDNGRLSPRRRRRREPPPPLELEAVVSCTSDGLVVVLRKARPLLPQAPQAPQPPVFNYENGLFAAPWGLNPIQPHVPPEAVYRFRPPLLYQYMPLREEVRAVGGPPLDQLMRSIQDVAVFAWALVGINGKLATYGHGQARGTAMPADIPVWDPDAGPSPYEGPENEPARRWRLQNHQSASRWSQGQVGPSSFSSTSLTRTAYDDGRSMGYHHHEPARTDYGTSHGHVLGSHSSIIESYTYGSNMQSTYSWMPSPLASLGSGLVTGYERRQQQQPQQQQHHQHHQHASYLATVSTQPQTANTWLSTNNGLRTEPWSESSSTGSSYPVAQVPTTLPTTMPTSSSSTPPSADEPTNHSRYL